MSSSESWSIIVSSLESLDNSIVCSEGIITLHIGCLQNSGLWALVYLWVPFNKFLPLMTSLEFSTRKSAYTYYKIHGFFIPTSWAFHSVPINFKKIHIFDMHSFKFCQIFHSNNLWNRVRWHRHMFSHVKLIALCHPFRLMIELPCYFHFRIFCLCLLNGIKITAKAQTDSTANRSDTVNVTCCKVNLIFLIIDSIALWRSFVLSLSTTAVKFINS